MSLFIKASKNTPEIKCDNGIFSITGRSFPENAETFFRPLVLEVESYLKKPLSHTRLIFQLEYVNSSTKFMVVELCNKMKVLNEKGNTLQVEYHCVPEDEIMIELFEELSSIVNIPFERKEIT